MTPKTDTVTIHALKTGLTVPRDTYGGIVLYQGQTVTLTAKQIEQTYDREGNSWLDLSEEDQRARWGEVRFGHGPAPEGMGIGDDDAYGARYHRHQAEVEYAKKISDPDERIGALRQIAKKYPEQRGTTQWTLREY
ncbi:hypothetical protein [Microbacterium sp. 2RAF4]|uniref:hypothetical protein n=1 Tax=Microbacterium sp. 2RAF4 TaxID=3232999 RepID=UPI003F9B2DA7